MLRSLSRYLFRIRLCTDTSAEYDTYRSIPGTQDVTAEAFVALLTQPQKPLSYGLIHLLGDEAPNGG